MKNIVMGVGVDQGMFVNMMISMLSTVAAEFADPKLQKEQKGTADDLLSASSKQDHLKW